MPEVFIRNFHVLLANFLRTQTLFKAIVWYQVVNFSHSIRRIRWI